MPRVLSCRDFQPGTPQGRVACWVKEVVGNEAQACSLGRIRY